MHIEHYRASLSLMIPAGLEGNYDAPRKPLKGWDTQSVGMIKRRLLLSSVFLQLKKVVGRETEKSHPLSKERPG